MLCRVPRSLLLATVFPSSEPPAARAAAIIASGNSMQYTRSNKQLAGGRLAPRMQRGQHSPACHEGRFASLGGKFQGISMRCRRRKPPAASRAAQRAFVRIILPQKLDPNAHGTFL